MNKKLNVRVEDVRIVACGRELGDEALVDDMVPAAAENGSDSDPVVTLFMVLKSTSSTTVSVQGSEGLAVWGGKAAARTDGEQRDEGG